jgi:hypothetical protein
LWSIIIARFCFFSIHHSGVLVFVFLGLGLRRVVMDDLSKFFCPNKKCSEYGIRGGENIRVRALYGKHKDTKNGESLETHVPAIDDERRVESL